MKELFIKVSTVHQSHFVIFNFLQGKVVCFGMRFQAACLDRVYLCWNAIFRLCLRHEDGVVEACIPGSISQKTVNFWFNSKIISLSINIQSLNFLSKYPIAKSYNSANISLKTYAHIMYIVLKKMN